MNIAQIEARLAQLAELRRAAEGRTEQILATLLADNRATTDEEAATLASVRADVAKIDNEVRALTDTLEALRATEASEGRASVADTTDTRTTDTRTTEAAAVRATHGAVQVRREALTYEQGDQRASYWLDLVAAETGHGSVSRDEARARLDRHAAEMRVEAPRWEARQRAVDSIGEGRNEVPVEYERRDLNRTDGTGGFFVPPLWAMQQYIDLARPARVMADLCFRAPLPGGTDSINIPKVSTGTAVAIQTADNAAVQETDLADTSVSAAVRTLAGQQDISLQALEQSPLSFDQIIFADLIADHAQKTDQQVISGTNSNGQVLGIRTIASVDTTAYTDASPTVAELYPKIADSYNQISTTRFLPPEVIVMHPRRWAWMLSSLDSTGRPLVLPNAAQNPFAVQGMRSAEGLVGSMAFGPVYVDPNIPTNLGAGTNEDVIILGRPSEYYLWEGPIRTRVLTEVLSGNLTVRLQVYNYLAFMPHRRPESTSLVGGTGLVTPTF